MIIKIFGLYFLITTLFSVLPANLMWLSTDVDVEGAILIIVIVAVVVGMSVFLFFKPDALIRLLKLDKGFDDERIDFKNFNSENVLKLAVVIFGGYFLIRNVPGFLSHTIFAFKASVQPEINENKIIYGALSDYISWATSFFYIVIGYLLLTNYDSISRRLAKQEDERGSSKT